MNSIIRESIPEIVSLCEKYNVSKLFAFGSVVSGKFTNTKSDIDLYVELLPMPAIERGQALIDLWDQLELLFGCKVDLLTDQPIRNKYFLTELIKTRQVIYDREKQEILI
jgi:predicted nucleotidyltransferase